MQKTNDYDGYAVRLAILLRSETQKPNTFIERPAMRALLPPVKGSRVLCVGSGTGEECGELLIRGAEVWGVDISENCLEVARSAFPGANLFNMDMHNLLFTSNSFDFIYSGLTIHYTEHIVHVLREMKRVLRPGGTMLLSTLHPVKWGAEFKRDANNEKNKSFVMGYDTFEQPARVYGDYLNDMVITQKPINYPMITYWKRSISSYMRAIQEADLELLNFVEPAPASEVRQSDPAYWEIHSKIPQFMIFVLRKRM
jgi:ubiquinone/menaquinone biosynthesis C-methylase UbiE